MLNDYERAELENYLANRFVRQPENIQDEDFISQWQEWIDQSADCEAGEILNTYICKKLPAKFNEPSKILIEIYNSTAGSVPVIIFDNASDFESFIVNLIYKGQRPDDIAQMGASFIFGKKQRFLVLSKKYYSNTAPEFVGLPSEEWREKSMILRREHECTHYYTKKFYGSASNNLHDELIADFFGIYAVFGYYKAKLFKHFMGIDGTHKGRLSLYTSGLSPNVRKAVEEIACRSSDWLEEWSKSEEFLRMSSAERINFLCEKNVTEMFESYIIGRN